MKNVYHNNIWRTGAIQTHVESTTILLIKIIMIWKRKRVFLSIELFKDPMLEMLDMYELKMVLFDNCKPEEFLLFVKISNASGMLVANVNIQYIRTMLHGLAIRKFDILCAKFVSTTMAHLNWVILGLGPWFFPVKAFSKQTSSMRRGMRESHELELRCYAYYIIYINYYLASFPWEKSIDKIGDTELNEIVYNSMPNIWIKQAYVQVFDFKTINFKRLKIFLNT